ncbi:phytoene desaturase family protein [Anoxybacillus flavithermus]|uniref:4,4'-diaponeurosporene oxygenase n=1 Tax=Anoxybacillus flavithermus (strain DSM 21510 / WK1) TaxID=491915 RepID=B7GLV3_ANOFW|nr:Phytoene dehydrogenase (Phytoene desaturase) [Anoxybacillus flavithermus WK1]
MEGENVYVKKVVIVGGGLGGLSAAVTLAQRGVDVQLFEKNNHFGGKLMPVQLGNYYFDFGPNTITMPFVFRHVIEQTGERTEDYLTFRKLRVHTKNVYEDQTTFFLSSDREYMKEQLAHIDPIGALRYDDFLREVERLYQLAKTHFFPRIFHSFTDYISPSLAMALLKARPFETLHHFFQRYFTNEHVIQAYDRYATYIGSSPYMSPATFAMIAYLEMVDGVYYVEGGNARIAHTFAMLARRAGATLHTNRAVKRVIVRNGAVKGVELEDGEKVEADVVIMNADLLQAYRELVDPHDRSYERAEPSISAFVMLVGTKDTWNHLAHHNVFFSDNYKQEFEHIFSGKYSEHPTIYVCAPPFTKEGSSLFILVNAPPLTKDGRMQVDEQAYKQLVYEKLRSYGLNIVPDVEQIITPLHIAEQFGAYRGALYGMASNRRRDTFLRPSNACRRIGGLYFVGGTTHPGGGSPMVVISGQNVAHHLLGIKLSLPF